MCGIGLIFWLEFMDKEIVGGGMGLEFWGWVSYSKELWCEYKAFIHYQNILIGS